MHKLIKSTMIAMTLPAIAITLPMTAQAEDDPEPYCPGVDETNENRRGICGNYASEISPAEAFLNTVVKRGKWSKPSERPVLLDVRSTPEYKAGHPEHSYNVPFPFIYQYCNDVEETGPQDDRRPDGACKSGGDRIDQDSAKFVEYVESIVPDKNTPVYTMCRTGVRSVGAATALTEAGYTDVRNIWEGFVGINLTAPFQDPEPQLDENGDPVLDEDGNPIYDYVVGPVDLNHDGQLTDEDKNGWRNHQGLPYETRLLPKLMWMGDYSDTYYWD
jgi:rhodanese-related sulfurtransferase